MIHGARLYRSASADGTTLLDLLLSLYDALAEDLRLIAEAAGAGDIAVRCAHSQHALLLIGHLESWIPDLCEPSVQEGLARFYSYLRLELIRLQATPEKQSFIRLTAQVGQIRAAWHERFWRAQTAPSSTPASLPHGSEPARLSFSA